jgi:hypothetical protein
VLGQLDIHLQKNDIGPHFIQYVNTNSKLVENLNLTLETMKLPEEIWGRIHNIDLVNDILDLGSKSKNRQMELHQNKLLHDKENNN